MRRGNLARAIKKHRPPDHQRPPRPPAAATIDRHFNCLACGCDVYRPERDRFDDMTCLNCWFGKAGATNMGI
jgi:hypothetical protein